MVKMPLKFKSIAISKLSTSRYFNKVFKIFMLFQAVLFIFNMFIFIYITRAFSEETKSYSINSINMINNTLEDTFVEMTRLGRATAATAASSSQLNEYDNFEPNDYVLLNAIKLQLSNILSVQNSIDMWFYYNRDKDVAICNEGIYEADTYFDKFYLYSGMYRLSLDNIITSEDNQINLLPVTQVTEWSLSNNANEKTIIPFVVDFKGLINQNSILVINIDTEKIKEITRLYTVSDGMSIGIVDSFGKIVSLTGNISADELQLLHNKAEQGAYGEAQLYKTKIQKQNMVTMNSRSFFPGWTTHISIPWLEFYKKSFVLFITLISTNMVIAIIGSIMAFAFSRRLFSPIYNLMTILYPQNNIKSAKRDELELISKRLNEIKNTNTYLKDDMQHMMPIMQDVFVKSMLQNEAFFEQDKNIKFLESKFNLLLSEPIIVCDISIIYRQSFLDMMSMDQQRVLKQKVAILLNSLVDSLFSKYIYTDFSDTNMVVILNVLADSNRDCVIASLKEIQKVFSYDSENIATCFVVSDTITNACSIPTAYQTLTEYYNHISLEMRNTVVDVSKPFKNETVNFKSMVTSVYNNLKSGEVEKASDMVVNFVNELNTEAITLNIFDMIYIAVFECCRDLLVEFNLDASTLYDFEYLDKNRIFNKEEFFEHIKNITQRTGTIIQSKNMSKFGSYVSYLNDNFQDQSICLESVSNVFGITPAYLSKSIKNEIGVSFSDYISNLRINLAKKLLLSTKLTVDEIATTVGISSRVTFNRLFNKYEGISPGKFRSINNM